jgi:hypothetical protein
MAIQNVSQQQEAEFFKLGGRYLISAESTPEGLLNDSNCMMASALGVLDNEFESLSNSQWAALYLFQQAKAMQDQAIAVLTKRGAFKGDR